MAADGSLVFDTKINIDGFKSAFSALETTATAAFKGISSNASAVSDAMAAAASSASKVGEEISSSMVKAAETVQQSAKASSEAGKSLEELGKSADTAGAKTKTLGDEAKGAGDGAKKLGQESEEAGKDVKNLGDEAEKASETAKRSMEVLGAAADKVGKAIKVALAAAATSLVAAGGYALKVGSDFEAGMSQVAAVSGATGSDLEALTEKAKEMGAKTKFSATESAEAFNYMAMAGWKTQDMLGGIEGVMNLAAASGENLATVSDIVTDALTAFGLAASDSGRFSDVLAAASSNANTNVGMMGATFKYVAPIAGSMGYSIEDTAVAIGLMANSSIKGEQAGTALRAMLTRLVKPPKDAAAALDALGISAANSDGTMRPLRDVIAELREKFSSLSAEQKTNYAASIAGQEAMGGLLAIVNASDADFEKLTTAINNSDGAALNMAETMQDNLQGSLTILGSTVEGLGIRFYDNIGKTAKNAVDSLIRTLSGPSFKNSFDRMSQSLGKIMEEAARLGEDVLPILVDGLAFLSDNFIGIAKTAGIVYASFETLKIIGATSSWLNAASEACKTAIESTKTLSLVNAAAATSQGILNGQLTLGQLAVGVLSGQIDLAIAKQVIWNTVTAAFGGPVGLAIAAIGALAVGIGIYAATTQQADEATQEFIDRNRELIGETDELIESSQSLNDAMESGAQERKDSIRNLDVEAQTAKKLTDRLYTLAGQTKKTAADKAEMASLVDELNQKFPELGLAVDKETGALNLNREAVDGLIEANIELAKAQAARAHMIEVAEQLADAEIKLNELTAKREELTATLNDSTQTYIESLGNWGSSNSALGKENAALAEELSKLDEEIEATETSITEANAEWESWSQYAEKAGAAAESTAESMDTAQKSADGLGDAAESLSDRFGAAMKSVGKDAEDAGKIIEDTMDAARDAATNAFSEIEQKSALSVDEMIANLQKNQEAVRQWGDNLKTLAEYGVNDGLIGTLREGGPEMAAQTQEIVDLVKVAADDSLGEVSQSAKEKLAELSSVFADGFTVGAQAGNQALEAEIIAMQGTMQTGGEETARKFGDGYRTGILRVEEEFRSNPPKLAEPIVEATVETISGLPDAIQGPSQETAQVLPNELNNAVPETESAANANKEAFIGPMKQVGVELPAALEPATTAITTFSETVKTTGTEGFTALSETAKTQMEAMAQSVEDQSGAASDALKKWFSDIQKQTDKETAEFVSKTEKQLKKMPPKFEAVGKESVKGIWKGMQAEQGWLNRQIASLIDSAIKAAKEAADIHSPSGETARQVGEPLAEGVAKGVEDKMPEVSERMNAWVKSLIDEFGEEALKNIGVTADAIADQFGGIYDTVKDHATNAFSTIKEADELSVQDLIHNLEDNQRAIEDWADNLQRAADRGLDEGLLQKFREAGPEMNNTLENIVNASDREFERLNEQCAASGETITYAFETIFDSMEPGIREAIAKAIAEYEKMPAEAEQAASGTGSGVARGVASGSGEVAAAASGVGSQIASGISSGTTAATNAAQALMGSVTAALGGASESARQAGVDTVNAFAAGITAQLETSPIDFAAAVTAADSDALAEAAKTVGSNVSKGLTEGIAAQFETEPIDFTDSIEAAGTEALYNSVKDIGGEVATSLTDSITKQLTDSPPDFKTAMEAAGNAALDSASTVFAQLPLRIAPHLETTRVRITEWLSAIGQLIVEQTQSFHNSISDALERMNETASEQMRIALENVRQWFSDQIAEADARMPEFTDAILSPLEQLPGEYEDIGRRMVQGLWDGMDSMRGWIEGQIQDFVDGLVEAAQEAADIHSPSHRMASAVGAPMAAGVGQGFKGEAPRVARNMEAEVNDMMRRMEVAVGAEAARYGQKAAVMQTNNSITNDSGVTFGDTIININWTGNGDEADVNRISRQIGKKFKQQVRARGGGVL